MPGRQFYSQPSEGNWFPARLQSGYGMGRVVGTGVKGKLCKSWCERCPKLTFTTSWLHLLVYWNPLSISWNVTRSIKKLSVLVSTSLQGYQFYLESLTPTIPYQVLQTATHHQQHVSHPCPQCPRSLSISTLSLPSQSSMLLHFLWALHQGTEEKDPELDELPVKQV